MLGDAVAVSSPQGRFAEGAALIDGRTMTASRAVGKQMFLEFDEALWLRVHLGIYGAWDFSGDLRQDATQRAARGRMGQTGMRGTGDEGDAPATVVGEHEDSLSSIGAPRRTRLRMAEAETAAVVEGWPPEPIGQVRVRLLTERVVADLRGPTACEVLDAAAVQPVIDALGPDPLVDDAQEGAARASAVAACRSGCCSWIRASSAASATCTGRRCCSAPGSTRTRPAPACPRTSSASCGATGATCSASASTPAR